MMLLIKPFHPNDQNTVTSPEVRMVSPERCYTTDQQKHLLRRLESDYIYHKSPFSYTITHVFLKQHYNPLYSHPLAAY